MLQLGSRKKVQIVSPEFILIKKIYNNTISSKLRAMISDGLG